MARSTSAAFVAWLLLVSHLFAQPGADELPPTRYEVSINGETFTLDEGEPKQVESSEHPGTRYQVAVRVAPFQHWKLNTVQFDYHSGFDVDDDRKPIGRTATLKHALGFVAVITDLGGTLTAEAKASALKLLVESMEQTLRDGGLTNIKAGKPQQRKLGKTTVDAVTIRYTDSQGDGRSSIVYLATGEKFACSCLVQCLDDDRENAVDLIKSTLESLAPL